MKYFLFAFLMLSLFISCDENKTARDLNQPVIDTVLFQNPTEILFRDTFLDLGTVKQGEKAPFVFVYTNKGKFPLLINNVLPGCGCTLANYSKSPIISGKTDSITGFFNSEGREGPYEKHVDVFCNTNQKVHKLIFKINVIK
jgi:hypothetical protein